MTTHRVFVSDSSYMKEISNNTIDLVITSPPYNVGKSYGLYDDSKPYGVYLAFLEEVISESTRVLKPGGHICIVVGDVRNVKDFDHRAYVRPTHSLVAATLYSMGIISPLGEIIWDKGVQTINPSGGGTLLGSYPYPPNPWIRVMCEYIVLGRKIGLAKARKVPDEIMAKSRLTKEEWKTYVDGIWHIPPVGQDLAKYSAFPEEIPNRLIRMYSYVGDTVLDPFYGTGTTGRVAYKLERNSIGYEIDEDLEYLWREGVPSLSVTRDKKRELF